MKKLLFIGIVALMVQSLGAVTLPSTSYSPYAGGGSSESSEVVFSSGSMVKGSYSALKSDMLGSAFDDCVSGSEVGSDERFGCCEEARQDCYDSCPQGDITCLSSCGSQYKTCIEAPSVPLDGGLSILLVLSLAGGAAKLLRNRDKE